MKNYWHCVIEVDVPEGCLPDGCDFPMRQAVERAATKLHPEAQVGYTASGWGLNGKGAKCVMVEGSKAENCISKEDVARR